jgi:hypothetical protein
MAAPKTVKSTGQREPASAVPATPKGGPTKAEEKAALDEKAALKELAEAKRQPARDHVEAAAKTAEAEAKKAEKANA